MKISLFQIQGLPQGKRNVKDQRLDQADKLVQADKKTYMQVELIPEAKAADADMIFVQDTARADLILKDWEFVETRLSRDPAPAERAVLEKLKAGLEKEEFLRQLPLSPDELKLVTVYNLLTLRPAAVVTAADLENFDSFLLQALSEAGFICFLTLGGKENRAWLIRGGTTAWEAAGTIHTDLQKGFIRAEIISFADLIQTGGETQAKRAGKMRLEQKDYVMQDCDVAHFRFAK